MPSVRGFPRASVPPRVNSRAILGSTLPLLLLCAVVACTAGCATFRQYGAEAEPAVALAESGRIDAAIGALGKDDAQDLLHQLELGELQRLRGLYAQSTAAWLLADAKVQDWEARARADPARVAGQLLSLIVSDKERPYEGRDFEKVMLTTNLALNDLAAGDFDRARVDIKRTHEREALIAELRGRELQKVEEESRRKGARTSLRELNGYPVRSLDNPEANALRNSYQNALSHYLAGYVYEAQGEASLAAAGYRQAIELQPVAAAALDDTLAGLEQRLAAPEDGRTDLLFVIGSGSIPGRHSVRFSLPIPVNRRLILVPVSFPVIQGGSPGPRPHWLRAEDGTEFPVVELTSLDAMARRALKDEFPGLLLRGLVRSTAKAVAQYEAQKNDSSGLISLALLLGSVITESADERGWRTLPAHLAVARARVAEGEHTFILHNGDGERSFRIRVTGRHAVVGLRNNFGSLLVQAPAAGASTQTSR